MSEKIFVSIGSYKDPMIVRTIKSLLTRAENPQNIRIVVLDQVGFSPDEQRPQNSKTLRLLLLVQMFHLVRLGQEVKLKVSTTVKSII